MTSLTTTHESTRRGGRGARRRILNAASELFYFEGINATGVGRIASKASVSKRTLYQHFPSKTALVEEYLRQLRQEAGKAEGTSPEMSDSTPRARLLALFDSPDPGDATATTRRRSSAASSGRWPPTTSSHIVWQ